MAYARTRTINFSKDLCEIQKQVSKMMPIQLYEGIDACSRILQRDCRHGIKTKVDLETLREKFSLLVFELALHKVRTTTTITHQRKKGVTTFKGE